MESTGAEIQAEVIDATQLPPRERQQMIFARFERLAIGESFILSSSHDPKPLYREFEAAYAGAYTWDCVESGPERWQVRIGRLASSTQRRAAQPPQPEPAPKLLCDTRLLAAELGNLSSGAV